MKDYSISINNLSKKYNLGTISSGTLSGDISSFWAQLRNTHDPNSQLETTNIIAQEEKSKSIWALKNINIDIKKGQIVGIIGNNGAGKSTLLKIISQITAPSTGNIKIRGRIASLLEVGTGFHPELTGKENIYLNGAILGMKSKEIDKKLEKIIEFSGVRKYINTPVKRYSSGMRVRLAFSVAAHLEPEILLIDEVLAVGDAEFQKKCLGRIGNIAESGRTVLFVSHKMTAIKSLCDRCIVLKNGELQYDGNVNDAIDLHLKTISNNLLSFKNYDITQNQITLNKISLSRSSIISGDSFSINFDFFKGDKSKYLVDITFHLHDENDILIFAGSTGKSSAKIEIFDGKILAKCQIPSNLMNEGIYSINKLLFVKNKGTILFELNDCFSFKINSKKQTGWIGSKEQGIIDPKLGWEIDFN